MQWDSWVDADVCRVVLQLRDRRSHSWNTSAGPLHQTAKHLRNAGKTLQQCIHLFARDFHSFENIRSSIFFSFAIVVGRLNFASVVGLAVHVHTFHTGKSGSGCINPGQCRPKTIISSQYLQSGEQPPTSTEGLTPRKRPDIGQIKITQKWLLCIILPRCILCRALSATTKPSVCLSVRQTRELWQDERNFCQNSYTIRHVNHSSFATGKTVFGDDDPLYRKFWT